MCDKVLLFFPNAGASLGEAAFTKVSEMLEF
jgi:hypothetical protein